MKSKQVLLLDIDKTLIDIRYQLTDANVVSAIADLQAAGWEVGLHSDTPIPRIAYWHERLGLNGPMIAELGNCIVDSREQVVFSRDDLQQGMNQLRALFVDHLVQEHCQLTTLLGDVSVNKDMLYALAPVWPKEYSFVLVHGLRSYSFGMYALKIKRRTLVYDLERLKVLAEQARGLFVQVFDEEPFFDLNEDYGICILQSLSARKGQVVAPLRDLGYQTVVMAGDSMSDNLGNPDVLQCAVGNAGSEYKVVCQFVAQAPMATGVIEIIEWLQKQPVRA